MTLPNAIRQLKNLKHLKLEHNIMTSIPACLYELPESCKISLKGNPLTLEARADHEKVIKDPNYQGPSFNFS
jgi:Leucine-rich repeat (LRR) protein